MSFVLGFRFCRGFARILGGVIFCQLFVCFVATAQNQGAPAPANPPPVDTVQELKNSLNQGMQQVEDVRRRIEEMTRPLQNVLKGVADRDVLQAIDDLLHKSNWRYFWWSQLGVLLFCFALRGFLLAGCFHWARRLWVDVWTTVLLLGAVMVLVPLFTIGEPYRKLTKTAWDLYWAM